MWDPKEQISLRDIGFGGLHRARNLVSTMQLQPGIDSEWNAQIASAFAMTSIAASLYRIGNALDRAFPDPGYIEDEYS